MKIIGYLLACTCLTCHAAVKEVPEIAVPVMAAPTIDGKLDSEEWDGAPGVFGLRKYGTYEMFAGQARLRVGRDAENLYLALRTELGPAGLVQDVPALKGNNDEVFKDDTLEFVFIPDMGGKGDIYHAIINNRGAFAAHLKSHGKTEWWPIEFRGKGGERGGFWEYELAMPLRQFGLTPGHMPAKSGLRLCRNWKKVFGKDEDVSPTQTTWEWKDAAFLSDASIPELTWSDSAPAVAIDRLLAKDKPDSAELAISIHNPAPTAIKCRVDYEITPSSSVAFKNSVTADVPAGKTKTVLVPAPTISKDEQIETLVQVSSEDGKTLYYKRFFYWQIARPEFLFVGDAKGEARFNVAYFPSHDTLTVEADVSQLKDKPKPGKMRVALRGPGGELVAQTELPKPVGGVSRLNWKVSDLKPLAKQHAAKPVFTVELRFDDKDDVMKTETFERHLLPWEGNQLGRSDWLIPPFTPIQIEKNTLKTILREHTLNGLGLPAQIRAEGETLLQGDGVHLEAVIDGKTHLIKGGALKFTERKPTSARTESAWSVGRLSGKAVGHWDFDGTLDYTLTLDPVDSPVTSLRLVIPLDDRRCPLMHVTHDGARGSYGGFIPAGQGDVWASTDLKKRVGLIGNYLPYIWVGGESRGLAVFGENDKGWLSDDQTPAQQLVRKDGTLSLIYNLVSRPGAWSEPRKIRIGFLATPIKPMPEGWRRWGMWSSQNHAMWGTPDVFAPGDLSYDLTCLGTGAFYGALCGACELEPAGEDTAVWEKMAETRKTRKIDSTYLDTWLKANRHKASGEQYFDPTIAGRGGCLWHGFGQMKNLSGEVMFYTNPRGSRFDTPAGKTYLNEWYRLPFNRKYAFGGGVQYDVDPVESFRDYSLWWYNQMFESGACQNLYWDDMFLYPNFKDVVSDAYLRPDGKMQPSVGMFNLRELPRRAAILQLERGMRPANLVHITSTTMAPLLAFSQICYGWECSDGTLDYQDRSSRDNIRACSIGRQFGTVPVVMAQVTSGAPEKVYDWCDRTGTGVLLTHELRWLRDFPNCWMKTAEGKHYRGGIFWKELKKLLDFGYGKPGVDVHNYWDEGYPLRIPGHETSSLVVSKPGAALLVVCDWDKGGDYQVELDLARLHLAPGFKVFNRGGQEPIQVKGNCLSFNLKKHDFIIIAVEQKPDGKIQARL